MSRGQTMRTPERVQLAQELRADGLRWREVADALGCSLSAAQEWAQDSDGYKREARKAKYRGLCVDCGLATSPSHDSSAPCARCLSCAREHVSLSATWTDETVVLAIRRWHAECGKPPSAQQWRTRGAGYWPPTTTAQRVFGTWSAAIRAAGFEPNPTGRPRKAPRP